MLIPNRLPEFFRRVLLGLGLTICCGAWVQTAQAQTVAPDDLNCVTYQDEGFTCEIILNGQDEVYETVLTLEDGSTFEHDFGQVDGDGPRDARVLYLIFDTSNPARGAVLRQSLNSAWSLIEQTSDDTLIGLGTFDENFAQVIAPTTDRGALRDAVSGITANGQNTHLYEAALDALAVLPDAPKGLRDLVIFSDGNAEDQSFSLADVSARARQDGVRVSGLGAVLRTNELGFLQNLERLAEETGGVYAGAVPGSAEFDVDALIEIADLGAGGGSLRFAEGFAQPAVFEMTLVDGRVKRFAIPALVDPVGEAQASQSPFDKITPLIWGLIAAVVLIGLWLLSRGRGREKDAAMPVVPSDTVTTSPPELAPEPEPVKNYGVLKTPDGTDLFLMSSLSTLGRSLDADIVIQDSSVSRRHATISVTASGMLQIVDLNSANGVFVNNKRVVSAEFNAGDTVRLGEVELVFGHPNS